MIDAPRPHTRAHVHLDRLGRNLRLLAAEAGGAEIWPVLKADAYGHGAVAAARYLHRLGCRTFCVAHVAEAAALAGAGVDARIVTLSPSLPEQADALVEHGAEPAVCTIEMVAALSAAARRHGRPVAVHLMVDTGMGRVGIEPAAVARFLEDCRGHDGVHVRGIMSHFPRADEADKDFSLRQLESFLAAIEPARAKGVAIRHMANSAALLDVPGARLDAVRPGIALYGLRPSPTIFNPKADALEPVLEWKTRVTFVKEVPAGTGLSYGHAYRTPGRATIATVPVGYGDGLSRRLSGEIDLLIGARRCPQVGRITMDMCLVDVTALGDDVEIGDEAVIIGRQGTETIAADELAAKLGTINYEIVTRIAARVPRVVLES